MNTFTYLLAAQDKAPEVVLGIGGVISIIGVLLTLFGLVYASLSARLKRVEDSQDSLVKTYSGDHTTVEDLEDLKIKEKLQKLADMETAISELSASVEGLKASCNEMESFRNQIKGMQSALSKVKDDFLAQIMERKNLELKRLEDTLAFQRDLPKIYVSKEVHKNLKDRVDRLENRQDWSNHG